mmetsp:Transcript_27932/g.80087  ORF Transcript_27932/g.80087 Transcript_27932/m.80087 type:complete len:289 (-) Transcript_27932:272-1138(-)
MARDVQLDAPIGKHDYNVHDHPCLHVVEQYLSRDHHRHPIACVADTQRSGDIQCPIDQRQPVHEYQKGALADRKCLKRNRDQVEEDEGSTEQVPSHALAAAWRADKLRKATVGRLDLLVHLLLIDWVYLPRRRDNRWHVLFGGLLDEPCVPRLVLQKLGSSPRISLDFSFQLQPQRVTALDYSWRNNCQKAARHVVHVRSIPAALGFADLGVIGIRRVLWQDERLHAPLARYERAAHLDSVVLTVNVSFRSRSLIRLPPSDRCQSCRAADGGWSGSPWVLLAARAPLG